MIYDNRFTLVLDKGSIGAVDGAGSVMTVPDIEEKPARGVFDIAAKGALTDVLDVVAAPPLRLFDRIDLPRGFATGAADVSARLALPLVRAPAIDVVDYSVTGTLRDAASEVVIPDRTLTSEALSIDVSARDVTVSGPIRVDGVPATTEWRQTFGEARSSAGGTIRLSPEALATLGVPVPGGAVSGSATALYALEIPGGGPPSVTLTSDLRGMGLRIDGLGWSKAPDARATLSLDATLGNVPEVPRFAMEAPGLALEGSLDDGLGAVELSTLRVGNWLNASARVETGVLALTGGQLDLRALPELSGGSGGSGRVSVDLDTLVVTDNQRLSPFRGDLTALGGGLSGDFQGRLNGGTVVRALLAPTSRGTSVRLQANDAGGILRDANLTPNATGGTMDIVLTPVGNGQRGTYDGQFLIEGISLQDAPVMAALLDAASVVGLLQQLGGAGIRFDTVDGRFGLTPTRLSFRDVAATGASLGISANGIYDMAAGALDIEGVVSPFYFLNAFGALVSRRGEGLFGMNYSITGETARPRITVNPLSMLTPGGFRAIFRRAPPE
ncbi:MAG: AsmA-like C-terminal region-containing protein [Pseudomonadota bacterium]